MANDKNSCFVESTLSFLIGAATGFVLGVLFAPASGEETRKKIHEGAVKTGEKAKESYEKVAREAEKGIKVVREKTAEGIESIKDFVEKKKVELFRKSPEEPAKVEPAKK
jgi:gas vesicle protein